MLGLQRNPMSLRRATACAFSALVAAALMIGAAPAVVHAAASPLQTAPDAQWAPWVGCWQGEEAAGAPGGEASLVCIRAGEAGVRIAEYRGERKVSERTIVADGTSHPVEQDGCTGTGTARWSDDGARLFLHSSLRCSGGSATDVSGIYAMLPGDEWLDAQAIEVDGQPLVRVRHYFPADPTTLAAARVEAPAANARIARTAATAPLSVSDVEEATTRVSPELVQVLIAERHAGFDLDGDALVRLADAGVPGSVTDMMIALSNPDRFDVDASNGTIVRGTRGAVAGRDRGDYGRRRRGYTRDDCDYFGFDAYSGYPGYYGYPVYPVYYGYAPYGHAGGCRYSPYAPYGYGYGGNGYGWAPWQSGRVIVVDRASDRNGRAVEGEGYTRRDGTTVRGVAHPKGGSDGRATTKGYVGPGRDGDASSGSSSGSTARTAHPRGGNGGNKPVRPAKPSGGHGHH